jgi:hypothetical protein
VSAAQAVAGAASEGPVVSDRDPQLEDFVVGPDGKLVHRTYWLGQMIVTGRPQDDDDNDNPKLWEGDQA